MLVYQRVNHGGLPCFTTFKPFRPFSTWPLVDHCWSRTSPKKKYLLLAGRTVAKKKGPFWPSSRKSPWLQPSIFVFSDLFMKELVVLQVLITQVVFHLPITGDIPGSSYHLPHRDITGILERNQSHKPWVKTLSCRHAHPHPQTETITPKYEANP